MADDVSSAGAALSAEKSKDENRTVWFFLCWRSGVNESPEDAATLVDNTCLRGVQGGGGGDASRRRRRDARCGVVGGA